MATGKGLARTATSPSNNISCPYLRPHLHMKLLILCLPKEPRKETKDERIPWSCFPTNIPPKRGNTVFVHVPRKSNPIIGKKSPCSQKEELNSFMLPRKSSHVAGASWRKKILGSFYWLPFLRQYSLVLQSNRGLEFPAHNPPSPRTRQHQHSFGIPFLNRQKNRDNLNTRAGFRAYSNTGCFCQHVFRRLKLSGHIRHNPGPRGSEGI